MAFTGVQIPSLKSRKYLFHVALTNNIKQSREYDLLSTLFLQQYISEILHTI